MNIDLLSKLGYIHNLFVISAIALSVVLLFIVLVFKRSNLKDGFILTATILAVVEILKPIVSIKITKLKFHDASKKGL